MFNYFNEFINLSDLDYVVFSLLSSTVTWLVGFVFMAIAIWVMAKKLNINKGRWMAFVPFLNWLLLGKIIGNAVVWGVKIKNVGLWAMILSIAQTVINFLLSIGTYLYMVSLLFNVDFLFTSQFLIEWVSGTGIFYNAVSIFALAVDIAFIFFEVSVIFLVFRLYAPESALLFSILSLFLDPPLFGILLFVVRNRPRNGFKQFYTVHNPYANFGDNGFGYRNHTPNQNNPSQNKPDKNNDIDPFPEFSNKSGDSSAQSDDSDEIFS